MNEGPPLSVQDFSKVVDFFHNCNAFFHARTNPGTLVHPDLVQHLHGVCRKRQDDFIGGRVCAAAALEEAGFGDAAVRVGDTLQPVWPEGSCGSISHTRGLYCAAAASREHCVSLGLDVEATERPVSDGAFSFIAGGDEAAHLETVDFARIRLFSAKECLYKLLFPLVGEYFSFDAARLVRYGDNVLELALTRDLGNAMCRKGSVFAVSSFLQGQWVASCAAIPAV